MEGGIGASEGAPIMFGGLYKNRAWFGQFELYTTQIISDVFKPKTESDNEDTNFLESSKSRTEIRQ